MKYFTLALLLTILFAYQLHAQNDSIIRSIDIPKDDAENLNVLRQWLTWNNPGSLLVEHLTKQATKYYNSRDKEISQLKSKADWLKWQSVVAGKINRILGTFPERTPLNAQITGVIEKDDYRIEIIFVVSSRGYYVTGCLYLPK